MLKLSHILRKYTSNLPITAEIHIPADANSEGHATIEKIGGEWSAINENYGKSQTLHVAGVTFEVITGIGQSSHEIYQNKVLISDRYNLISHDISNSIQVPNIRILINSSAFELPFGRHCLRNESVLIPLSQSIREQIIPAYFDYLLKTYDANPDAHLGLGKKVEEIAVALVIQIPDHDRKWATIPVFRIYPEKRVSLLRLEAMVTQAGKVYLEETENTGADYSCFDAPILLQDQPQGCINFLKDYFRKELINLSLNDVVMEMPANPAHELTKEEITFQENLGLATGIGTGKKNKSAFMEDAENDRLGGSSGFAFSGGKYKKPEFANPESNNANNAYRQLRWKVNYLVGRDGKTPCLTHRFIVNHNTIVLNLSHPDVKDLVRLSRKAPGLSSHWAVAMCLTEDNKILSFLSAESREDLLLVDALLKLNASNETSANQHNEEYKKIKKSIRDLLRDTGIDFGVN